MFNNILIGIDDGGGGRDAIALARQLVDQDGKLQLAHVHNGYPVAARGSNGEFERVERDLAADVLSRAAKESGIERTVGIGSSSVGRGLHELAELTGADLLVVGSTRRGLVGRVMLGNDTNRALNGAPCAVAVAPVGYALEDAKFGVIGVAYNTSSESDNAIAVARAIGAEKGAELSALRAIVIPGYVLAPGPLLTEWTLEKYMEDARDQIAGLGGVEAHIVYGDPVEELTEYTKSVDLLVVGSRDYGPVGRLVHGSISHRLARTAHCPVLVLTRASRSTIDQRSADESAAQVSV